MRDAACTKHAFTSAEIAEFLHEVISGDDDASPYSKGQRGKIAVVGGSLSYTGAPFFAASSAFAVGADLVFVYCHPEAVVPIKAYSPDLIVIPLWNPRVTAPEDKGAEELESLVDSICRADVICLGPGAGSSEEMQRIMVAVIEATKVRRIPLVCDADVFRMKPDKIRRLKDHPTAILTPNLNELRSLEAAFGIVHVPSSGPSSATPSSQKIEAELFLFTIACHKDERANFADVVERVQTLSKETQLTLVAKGSADIIARDGFVVVSNLAGTSRRCGGLGDVLAGTCAAMIGFTVGQLNRRCSRMYFSENMVKLSTTVKHRGQYVTSSKTISESEALQIYSRCIVNFPITMDHLKHHNHYGVFSLNWGVSAGEKNFKTVVPLTALSCACASILVRRASAQSEVEVAGFMKARDTIDRLGVAFKQIASNGL